jgi:uncharacterized protein
MSTSQTKPIVKRKRVFSTLIDVDVHPIMREGIETLIPYMSRRWREIFSELPHIVSPARLGLPYPFTDQNLTPDAAPPDGSTPGSDPQFMSEDYLDRYDVGIAQLVMLEAFSASAHCPDLAMQSALISAFNDWMLDEWLTDARMRYALVAPAADAERGAAEIRRLGSDPRVCSVCIAPASGRSMGATHYNPIYAAAIEHGLPVITHSAGAGLSLPGDSYVEDRINLALTAWIQVNSLVLQGTFERYRELKIMILENGFSWIVPLMWRMDAGWRRNRSELPWLRHWPSEYVRDHIRLSTQPVDDDPDATELYHQIELEKTYLSEILCYSSDYPHWDNDRPGAVFNKVADETKQKIFCDNARNTLRI